ncbi:MAG: hypothetical protein ACP5JJ_17930, partial [Anaerolineae bacterium]
MTSSEPTTIQIVVGFQNYEDVKALEAGLQAYNQRLAASDGPGRPLTLVSARQDAHKIYNDAVTLEADLVLLCPLVDGYR